MHGTERASRSFILYHRHMNLARHSISATDPVLVFDARFDPECRIFTISTKAGFAVYRTWPLQLLRKRGMCTNPNLDLLLVHSDIECTLQRS